MDRFLRRCTVLIVVATVAALLPLGAATAAVVNEVRYVPTVGDAVMRVEIRRNPAFDVDTQPVQLTLSPYHTLNEPSPAGSGDSSSTDRGIAIAAADVLGTRGSTGCWDYGGEAEQQSGVDVVNFLSGLTPDVDGEFLEWSNGNVVMGGGSYDGTTATMVAAAGDAAPGLKAIMPVSAISHWYGYAYHNGVRYFLNSENPADEGFDTPLAFDHGFGDTVAVDPTGRYFADTVLARADECGAVEHEQQAYSRNPDYTDFWLERDYAKDAANFRAAVLIGHGWNDYNVKQDEAIRLWEALEVDDPETPEIEGPPEKFLFMTQDQHAPPVGPEWDTLRKAFSDYYLFNDDGNPEHQAIADAARVVLDAQPAVFSRPQQLDVPHPEILTDSQFPPTGTTDVTLFVNRAFEQDVDGVTVPGPGTGEPGHLEYDNRFEAPFAPVFTWLDTTASTEEVSQHDPLNDGRGIGGDQERPGGHGYYSLYFQTDPLAADTRIAGRAVIDGFFDTQLPGGTVTPILLHVLPDGTPARVIQRGFFNLDYHSGLDRANHVAGWKHATIELLPEDYIVQAGHRIGLLLQSNNAVWALPGNPQGPVDVATGPVADVTDTGTTLTLPVVDDENADPAALFIE